MVSFQNEFCPNWVYIKCKPCPFGNKYHTITCCLSKIIFIIELAEMEKDCPKEGDYSSQTLKTRCHRLLHFVVISQRQFWVLCLFVGFWVWIYVNTPRTWEVMCFWNSSVQEERCWMACRFWYKECSCSHAGQKCWLSGSLQRIKVQISQHQFVDYCHGQ